MTKVMIVLMLALNILSLIILKDYTKATHAMVTAIFLYLLLKDNKEDDDDPPLNTAESL
nr:MAG TPA: hypothetical protein [Caudoviricetes sp.]